MLPQLDWGEYNNYSSSDLRLGSTEENHTDLCFGSTEENTHRSSSQLDRGEYTSQSSSRHSLELKLLVAESSHRPLVWSIWALNPWNLSSWELFILFTEIDNKLLSSQPSSSMSSSHSSSSSPQLIPSKLSIPIVTLVLVVACIFIEIWGLNSLLWSPSLESQGRGILVFGQFDIGLIWHWLCLGFVATITLELCNRSRPTQFICSDQLRLEFLLISSMTSEIGRFATDWGQILSSSSKFFNIDLFQQTLGEKEHY